MPTTLTAPGLTPGLTSPGLTPGLTSPGITPGLTTPSLGTDPAAAATALADPTLADPGLTNPAIAGQTPVSPALNPALTSPTEATSGGLTTPSVAAADPLAATPISNGVGLPAPGEVPISAPIGLEPAATYPILGGDPGLGASSLGAMPASGE